MTSKRSFLVSLKENNKRRIWVWIVSFLTMLLTYPGIMTMYISRIKFWNEDGAYVTVEMYKRALCSAVTDALGFHHFITIAVTFLAIIIGVQEFSYLYSRKKVDMYHSVPVSAKRRFVVIYINGVLTYVIPCLICVALAIIMAAAQGGMSSMALAECGIALFMNLIYFMVVYNMAILAVMLTGNVFITAIAIGVFLSIGYLWQYFFINMQYNFFETACTFFDNHEMETTLSICLNHLEANSYIKRLDLPDIVKIVFALSGRWFVEMLIIGALAFFCYLKRPSEAAGKAIAYKVITPFLKVIIAPTVGLIIYTLVFDGSYSNTAFAIFAMIIGTILCAGVMEIIYEFDMRAAIKHLVSTGISVVVAITIFCIFYFDIFSYDAYVPDEDKVESIAISINPYVNHYYKFNDDVIRSIDEGVYLKDNMFITDVEPVLELVKNNQKDMEDVVERQGIYILYRLKSGREVSRQATIDLADVSNAALLDKIMGTKEYREGAYQLFKDADLLSRPDTTITYKNGIVESNVPHKENEKIRAAWLKDMENFNFSLARNNLPCGYINTFYGVSYIRVGLPVYESFTNTIACLEENNAYYPLEINAEDVLTLSVTNYNYGYDNEEDIENPQPYNGRYNSYAEAILAQGATAQTSYVVREDFSDPQEIAEIVKGLYSTSYNYGNGWISLDMLDRNYEVTISYKSDAAAPYEKGYVEYTFISGKVPEFVAERTAPPTEE
ncbi:MAG: hypothetical protein HDR03_01085 [Lachnospiraceae bacterium]|nr:hypothetical protein [Lachnospiraceae bacterium]